MKKKNNVKEKKSPKGTRFAVENTMMGGALIVAGFALALTLFSLWQTSASTYNEFVTICKANGDSPTCMGFYWRQFNYYQNVYLGALYVTVVSVGVAIWAKVKKI